MPAANIYGDELHANPVVPVTARAAGPRPPLTPAAPSAGVSGRRFIAYAPSVLH